MDFAPSKRGLWLPEDGLIRPRLCDFVLPFGFFAGGGISTIAFTESGTANLAVSGTSLAYTVPAGGIPAGSLIVVQLGLFAGSFSGLALSVSDTRGNSYNSTASGTGITSIRSFIIYCPNAIALLPGDTITASFGMSGTAAMHVGYAASIVPSAPLDQSRATGGSTTAPTATTGATTVAKELAVAGIAFNGIDVVTEAAGWTGLTESSTGTKKLHCAYQLLSATGPVTYAPTLAAARGVLDSIATFKGT